MRTRPLLLTLLLVPALLGLGRAPMTAQESHGDDTCPQLAELYAALKEALTAREMLRAELAETHLELVNARLETKTLQFDVQELQRRTQYEETSSAQRLIRDLGFGRPRDSALEEQSREVQP